MLLGVNSVCFSYTTEYLHSILIVTITMLLFLSLAQGGKIRGNIFSGIQISYIIFSGWIVLSFFWSSYPIDPKRYIVMLYTLIVAFLFYKYLDNQRKILLFFDVIILGAVLLSFHIISYLGVDRIFKGRMEYTTVSINRVGTIYAAAIFFASFLLCQTKRKRYILPIFFLFPMWIWTGSKTAILMLSGSLFTYLILKDRMKSQKVIKNLLAAILIILGVLFLINTVPVLYELAGKRVMQLLGLVIGIGNIEDNISNSLRLKFIKFGIEGFLKNPFWGYGEAQYEFLNPVVKAFSHSNFVEIAFNLGIIGLISFYFPYYKILKKAHQTKNKIPGSYYAFAIGFLVSSFIESIALIFYYDLYNWLIVIAVYKLIELEGKKGILTQVQNL